MPLSTIFELYYEASVIGRGNQENQEKMTNLS